MGAVSRPTLKSDAENVVKRIEGVTRVVNNIEVLPLSPMDDGIRRAGCRAIYGDPSLSTRYGFRALPSIHIIVKNGHVTLEGVVANEGDKNLINLRANGVPDVFGVDRTICKSKGTRSRLIQVDIASRRGLVWIFFGLLEKLVKLLLQYSAVRLFHFHLLAKDLVATPRLSFELSHRCRQILDGWRLLRDCMRDHRARLRVDLQEGVATGTLDLKQAWAIVPILALPARRDPSPATSDFGDCD